MMVHRWLLLCALLLAPVAWAAPIDSFSFSNQADEDRFKRLIEEIRCVKCQNTTIAGSNADLARDHRSKVYQMMQQGKSDLEIRQWFVARYGDFVLYRPQVDSRTWLLWGLPLLLVPLGIGLLVVQLRRQRAASAAVADEVGSSAPLSAEEERRLSEVLK
jgi:cytochrome c-type biogenesis protein CcmH